MLTAAIGVHSPVKGDVRRLVVSDDLAGGILHQDRFQPPGIILYRAPAIVKGMMSLLFIPASLIGNGAAPAMFKAFLRGVGVH